MGNDVLMATCMFARLVLDRGWRGSCVVSKVKALVQLSCRALSLQHVADRLP